MTDAKGDDLAVLCSVRICVQKITSDAFIMIFFDITLFCNDGGYNTNINVVIDSHGMR